MPDDELSRLKWELRTVRERQAHLRYELRFLYRSVTALRREMRVAIRQIDRGSTELARAQLEAALLRSKNPEPDHVPPGAKRGELKRQTKKARDQP